MLARSYRYPVRSPVVFPERADCSVLGASQQKLLGSVATVDRAVTWER